MTRSVEGKRSLTPKQRVRRKYPTAFSYRWADSTCIYRPLMGGNINMGHGRTAALAWADALANMRSGAL